MIFDVRLTIKVSKLIALVWIKNGLHYTFTILRLYFLDLNPDNKVHRANMGPTWVLSAPDGPHVGPMNPAIWEGMDTWSDVIRVKWYNFAAMFS